MTPERIAFWCIVHRSPGEWEMNRGNTDELRCWWDQLAGPRPGRGRCQFVEAEVSAVKRDACRMVRVAILPLES